MCQSDQTKEQGTRPKLDQLQVYHSLELSNQLIEGPNNKKKPLYTLHQTGAGC